MIHTKKFAAHLRSREIMGELLRLGSDSALIRPQASEESPQEGTPLLYGSVSPSSPGAGRGGRSKRHVHWQELDGHENALEVMLDPSSRKEWAILYLGVLVVVMVLCLVVRVHLFLSLSLSLSLGC